MANVNIQTRTGKYTVKESIIRLEFGPWRLRQKNGMRRKNLYSGWDILNFGGDFSIFCSWLIRRDGSASGRSVWDTKIQFVELIGGNRILESGKSKKDDLGFLIFPELGKYLHWCASTEVLSALTTACCHSNSLSTKGENFSLSHVLPHHHLLTTSSTTHHIIHHPSSTIYHPQLSCLWDYANLWWNLTNDFRPTCGYTLSSTSVGQNFPEFVLTLTQ